MSKERFKGSNLRLNFKEISEASGKMINKRTLRGSCLPSSCRSCTTKPTNLSCLQNWNCNISSLSLVRSIHEFFTEDYPEPTPLCLCFACAMIEEERNILRLVVSSKREHFLEDFKPPIILFPLVVTIVQIFTSCC